MIWDSVRGVASFFADGRMTAEAIRVLASDCPSVDAVYPKSLFSAGEAFAGTRTAKSTIYTANIAAENETLLVPMDLLAAIEGSRSDPVALAVDAKLQGTASWTEQGAAKSHPFRAIQANSALFRRRLS